MHPLNLTANTALFLDFDGTLVPIAPTPDSVVVPDGLPGLLGDVRDSLGGALAIVSGRGLGDVFQYLAPFSGPGAGSHGLELRMGDGSLIEPDAAVGDAAKDIIARLKEFAATKAGVLAEEKSWSASVHYRGNPGAESEAIAAIKRAVAAHEGWEVTFGKMVAEARPAGVSKATAVETFMTQPQFANRVPVFIGDDVTDEDGMRAVMKLGGFGIKVGEGESVARYRLESPEAVYNYLSKPIA